MAYVVNGLQDATFLHVLSTVGEGQLKEYSIGCSPYGELVENFIGSYSTQPIHSLMLSVILKLSGIHFFFLWTLLILALNFIVAGYLFRRFKRIGLIYTSIFTFSSYFWIKVGLHPELMELWLLSFFLVLLLGEYFCAREPKFVHHLIRISFFVLASLISNYFGFIIITTYCTFLVSYFIFYKRYGIYERGQYSRFFFPSLLVTLLVVPFFVARVPEFYTQNEVTVPLVGDFIRPYEDFFTFSLRPWYFFIPSPKNPIYGEFSKTILSKIESTDYFLADDYFPAEHSAAFFGYLFLVTFAGCLIFGYRKLDYDTKRRINVLLLTIVVLIAFTMPPYFTISGLKIYTPGHLIAVFFPMFRVTARFSPMILLLMLVVMAEIINVIHVYKPKFFRLFMPILFVVTLAETFVPLKITKYDKVPEPYIYMGAQPPMSVNYLVYPYSKSNESLFWLPEHKQCLMNVRDYRYEDISSEKLTLELFEPGGLEKALDKGVTHVLVYDGAVDEVTLENYPLEKVNDFSDSTLYKIVVDEK